MLFCTLLSLAFCSFPSLFVCLCLYWYWHLRLQSFLWLLLSMNFIYLTLLKIAFVWFFDCFFPIFTSKKKKNLFTLPEYQFGTQTIAFVPYSHSLVTMSSLMNWLPYGLWSKDTKNILQGLPIYFYFASSHFQQRHMASTLTYIKSTFSSVIFFFFYQFSLFGTLLSQFLPFLNIFCAGKICQVFVLVVHLWHLTSVWYLLYLTVSYNYCSLFFALSTWLQLLLSISFLLLTCTEAVWCMV